MPNERELGVERMQKVPRGMVSHQQPEKLVKDGVWLECAEDGKRCGDFEEGVVDDLFIYAVRIEQSDQVTLDVIGLDRFHTPARLRRIATAISRVLQEAADG